MSNESKIKFSRPYFLISVGVVAMIWFIYWYEIKFQQNFNSFGLYPRTLKGLRGVLFSPFIHGSTSHLFNNTVPFLVLINILFSFYKESAWKVILWGWVFSGILTWVIGRPSYHIGLSGIIYVLFSFIFFSGVLKKHYQLMSASLMIIFLYGSMIWYILPIKDGVSWEGHLSGFIIGLICAYLFRRKGIKKVPPVFKETEFDQLFDDYGNFIGEQKNDSISLSDE